MYGRRRSLLLEALLAVLASLYGAVVRLRAFAYEAGVLRTNRLPCKVISVGNITLGGTGKTPAVIHIAGTLTRKGRRCLVLSRGYGRTDESAVTVVSDGGAFIRDAASGGDEPVLIAERLRQVPVVAGSDRYRAGAIACERFQPDAVVLDDGFQHLGLARDLNIALVDGADPFGSGRLFPAGILREPLSALRRAGAVVITRADQAKDLEGLMGSIGRHTPAPLFTARYVPKDLVDLTEGTSRPLAALRGAAVIAFAGIARPDSFEALLRSLGADVRGLTAFPDHYRYTPQDVADMTAQAKEKGASMLVTTEKDAARLKGMTCGTCHALRIDLEVLEKDAWDKVLSDTL